MIEPLRDRIIVKRLAPETISAGGIVIPDAHQEKPDRGIVLAVGPGIPLEDGTVRPLEVKVGFTVVFGKNVGQTIRTDEGDVLAMRECDLYGYLEDSCSTTDKRSA